eukprot:6745556-Alexandrium_andersonii.AAC.1
MFAYAHAHAHAHARARACIGARTRQGTVARCPRSARHSRPVPALGKAQSPGARAWQGTVARCPRSARHSRRRSEERETTFSPVRACVQFRPT